MKTPRTLANQAEGKAPERPLSNLRDCLKALTADNLAILAELERQATEINKAIQTQKSDIKNAVLLFISEVIREYEVTAEDVLAIQRKTEKSTKPAIALKFRDPENHDNIWSGRGARPRWLTDRIKLNRSPFVEAATSDNENDAVRLNERLAKGLV